MNGNEVLPNFENCERLWTSEIENFKCCDDTRRKSIDFIGQPEMTSRLGEWFRWNWKEKIRTFKWRTQHNFYCRFIKGIDYRNFRWFSRVLWKSCPQNFFFLGFSRRIAVKKISLVFSWKIARNKFFPNFLSENWPKKLFFFAFPLSRKITHERFFFASSLEKLPRKIVFSRFFLEKFYGIIFFSPFLSKDYPN